MEKQIYGYARVSSRDQNEERQLIALKQAMVPEQNIYIDKMSGKDFERPNYKKVFKKLKNGDLLVVLSIDRLGRNYNEILEQWHLLTKDKGVDIRVLDMPLLDTRNKENDLTGTLIADIVLQLLSYVAQQERENIKVRQRQGIDAAKKRGVKFGRPLKKRPDEYECYKNMYLAKKISARRAALELNIAPTTFARWVKVDSGQRNL